MIASHIIPTIGGLIGISVRITVINLIFATAQPLEETHGAS